MNRITRSVFGPTRKEKRNTGRLLFRSCGQRPGGAGLGRRPLLVSQSRAQLKIKGIFPPVLLVRRDSQRSWLKIAAVVLWAGSVSATVKASDSHWPFSRLSGVF